MTPAREKELRENIFEMWFELLRRSCEKQCEPDLGGTQAQLDSEYLILENSKEILKKNFIEHYHIDCEIIEREDDNTRLIEEIRSDGLEQSNGAGKGSMG